MKLLIEIDPNAARDIVAAATRAALESVVLQNMMMLRGRKVPRLYDAGVRYRRPFAGDEGEQRVLPATQVVAERSGTCVDLVCYRVAELRALGDPRIGVAACKWRGLNCHHGTFRNGRGVLTPACPGIKIYWRRDDARIFHCEVRLPNGSAEDPSRFLGMGGKVREA